MSGNDFTKVSQGNAIVVQASANVVASNSNTFGPRAGINSASTSYALQQWRTLTGLDSASTVVPFWWDMTTVSGATIVDKNGSSLPMTLTGSPTVGADGVVFPNSASVYGYTGATSYPMAGNHPFTHTILVKWTTLPVSGTASNASSFGVNAANQNFTFYRLVTSNTKITSSFGGSGALTSVAAIGAGTWAVLAGVYDGTNFSLYVNGVLDSSVAYSSANISGANGFWAGLYIASFQPLIGVMASYQWVPYAYDATGVTSQYAALKAYYNGKGTISLP
jgi:hypothetical protein